MSNNLEFLGTLETIVRERLAAPSPASYSAQLAAGGASRVAQKLGEEALELALAAVTGSRDEQLEEAADLVYHLILLLATRDLTLADVSLLLEQRHRKRNAPVI